MKPKLSAIIVTRNEEKKIHRCLESLRWLDEIVVVDQSSTDNTVSICKEYTDNVFMVSSKGFCEPDRAVAAAKTKNEWIIYIDADEEVSVELKAEIESILSKGPKYNSYYIPRKNIFLGEWIRGSGWYPGYVLRLFRKGSIEFSEDIHTDVIPLTDYGYLKHHIIHYTCESLEEYIQKSNRYTGVLANQAYLKGERLNPRNFILKLFIVPAAYSFQKFFLKRGFRDGFCGFLIAFLTFLTVFMKYAKLWEIQKKSSSIKSHQ